MQKARGETHRRYDDFVARTDARDFERHLKTRSGRGHDPHVPDPAQVRGESRFKGSYLGTAGQLPRPKYVRDGGNALFIDRGARKGQERLHTELRDTSSTPVQISAIPSTLGKVSVSPNHATDTAATTT